MRSIVADTHGPKSNAPGHSDGLWCNGREPNADPLGNGDGQPEAGAASVPAAPAAVHIEGQGQQPQPERAAEVTAHTKSSR
jgi:hypothetical protein